MRRDLLAERSRTEERALTEVLKELELGAKDKGGSPSKFIMVFQSFSYYHNLSIILPAASGYCLMV